MGAKWASSATDNATVLRLGGEEVSCVEQFQYPVVLGSRLLLELIPKFLGLGQPVQVFLHGCCHNSPIALNEGERAFVFSASVDEGWIEAEGHRALVLSMRLKAPIWNNSGDVAYLRNGDGTFIDHMTVGMPARHPGGH